MVTSRQAGRALTLLVAAGLLSLPALAAKGRAAACPKLEWNAGRTADPTAADLAMLSCWADAGSAEAGYMLAMLIKTGRGVPADAAKARARLAVLAEG